MKRTPLRRGKPLRRTTRLRARSQTKAYRRRERDVPRMLFAKRQPCVVRELPPHRFVELARALFVKEAQTACCGPVEGDHMGDRGLSQKADDSTVVGICRGHHRERTDHTGTFRPLTRDELRAWRTAAIERTQAAWSNQR